MSQMLFIKVQALEKRVSELEARLSDPVSVRRGYQGFHVFRGGEQITESPMKRAEAEAYAEALRSGNGR